MLVIDEATGFELDEKLEIGDNSLVKRAEKVLIIDPDKGETDTDEGMLMLEAEVTVATKLGS